MIDDVREFAGGRGKFARTTLDHPVREKQLVLSVVLVAYELLIDDMSSSAKNHPGATDLLVLNFRS